ncbi:MAG: FliG C-terminal domain-containing protein [Treponema sp.]
MEEERGKLNEKLSMHLNAISTAPLGPLLSFLYSGSPLQAAIMVACLEPEKASLALAYMPEYMQRSVITALAHGIRVPADVLERIAADAEETLQQEQSDEIQRISVSFMEDFQELIPHLNRRTVKSILELLKKTEPERYEEVHSSLVTFEDIMLLDDRDVQRLLKEVPFQQLASALISAPESLKEKIKRNMSKRMAARLEETIKTQDWMSSVTNPEKIQDRIADTILRLAKAEEIIIPRNSDSIV